MTEEINEIDKNLAIDEYLRMAVEHKFIDIEHLIKDFNKLKKHNYLLVTENMRIKRAMGEKMQEGKARDKERKN